MKVNKIHKSRVFFLILMPCIFLCSSFSPKSGPGLAVRTVVIDAGHGGKDPGCHGIKHKEKDVALAISLKLGQYINKYLPDVKVVYTRKTDVFVELQERAAIANTNNADLFICIHCNASVNKDIFGSETYVMGLHKTKNNLDVAKRENASILMEENYQKKYDGFDPNSDEANIIFSMFQNAHLERSLNLAAKIQDQYRSRAGRVDKGVKQAGFLVLWKTAMPSLLTETGFLTNAAEENFLGSATGQDYMAASLFRAFRKYKDEMEGRGIVKYNDEVENQFAHSSPHPPDSSTKRVAKELTVMLDTASKPKGKSSVSPSKSDTSPVTKAPVKKDVPDRTVSDSAEKTAKSTQPVPLKIDTTSNLKLPGLEVKETKKEEADKGNPKKEEVKKEDTKPTEIQPANESGVLFRVQLLSSDKQLPLNAEMFKGIAHMWEYSDKGSYKYTCGAFKTADTAAKLQTEMRNKGFPGAFVVAFKDGKRIPVSDAIKLLKP